MGDSSQRKKRQPQVPGREAPNSGFSGAFNSPQLLTIASVWYLPLGHGKRYFQDASAFWDHVVGGWAINGIATFSSGNPFTVNAPNNTPDPLTNFRANQLCDGRAKLQNTNIRTNGLYWFNPSCFAAPLASFFGGVNNWDLAVEKDTHVRESVMLRFRAEFFNAWNHAQFMNPDSRVGDANFGQVTQARAARKIQFGLRLLW